MRWLALLLALLIPALASADTTSFRTAGTETDAGACYSNDTAHTVADVAADDDAPQTGRVEGSCIDSFRLSNFGFTTGDVPAGATVDGITVHFQAHGGVATQANRRRVDVWMVDEAAADCLSAGAPGRDNHQLPLSTEDDATWTADDLADTTWNCGFVAADVIDTDFGIRWQHTSATGGNVIGIDFVEIQIVFTPAGGARRRTHVIGGE